MAVYSVYCFDSLTFMGGLVGYNIISERDNKLRIFSKIGFRKYVHGISDV